MGATAWRCANRQPVREGAVDSGATRSAGSGIAIDRNQRRHRGGTRQSALRMFTGGICSASRYLAIVRRATRMPCSPSMSAILLSVSGVFVFSAALSCLISARVAVADAAPPVSVAAGLPSHYWSANGAQGGRAAFCVLHWGLAGS